MTNCRTRGFGGLILMDTSMHHFWILDQYTYVYVYFLHIHQCITHGRFERLDSCILLVACSIFLSNVPAEANAVHGENHDCLSPCKVPASLPASPSPTKGQESTLHILGSGLDYGVVTILYESIDIYRKTCVYRCIYIYVRDMYIYIYIYI